MATGDRLFQERRDFRAGIGACVDRARRAMGWNIDELAAKCGGDRDVSQVGRWCRGTERPQFDVLLGIEEYGDELLIELAAFRGARILRRVEFPERRRA
jgi:transcriptional regulator with XRE-family HTH domain